MSIPKILGSVFFKDVFTLVSIVGGKPKVLAYTGSSYSFTSDISGAFSLFTPSGTPGSLVVADAVKGGFLSYNGTSLVNVGSSTTVAFSQDTYAVDGEALLLSSVPYRVGGMDNVVVLPIFWYYGCSSNGTNNLVSSPADSVSKWFCMADPNSSACQFVPEISAGWKTLPDCIDGVVYNYCKKGTGCGTDNCKGSCPSGYCHLEEGEYLCNARPKGTILSNPYFIGGMACIVLVIIIFVLIIVILKK